MKHKSHKIYVAFSAKITAAGRNQAGSAVIKKQPSNICVFVALVRELLCTFGLIGILMNCLQRLT